MPLGPPEDGIGKIYAEHFNFVWRNLRRLGISSASMDDAVQDVFLVVHRRLPEFEGRSQFKTWLFGIVLRVARNHRRTARRHFEREADAGGAEPDQLSPDQPFNDAQSPYDEAERREAAALLRQVLATMNDERRNVFVLVELEQLTVPEVAAALGINLNTAYTRLRDARQIFESAVTRYVARDRRETR